MRKHIASQTIISLLCILLAAAGCKLTDTGGSRDSVVSDGTSTGDAESSVSVSTDICQSYAAEECGFDTSVASAECNVVNIPGQAGCECSFDANTVSCEIVDGEAVCDCNGAAADTEEETAETPPADTEPPATDSDPTPAGVSITDETCADYAAQTCEYNVEEFSSHSCGASSAVAGGQMEASCSCQWDGNRVTCELDEQGQPDCRCQDGAETADAPEVPAARPSPPSTGPAGRSVTSQTCADYATSSCGYSTQASSTSCSASSTPNGVGCDCTWDGNRVACEMNSAGQPDCECL